MEVKLNLIRYHKQTWQEILIIINFYRKNGIGILSLIYKHKIKYSIKYLDSQ